MLANEFITHNTRLIRIALPEWAGTFGLTLASCVVVRILDPTDESKFITRPYTPVTTEAESQRNLHVDFIIKGYHEGSMSSHMTRLRQGDIVHLKGPTLKIDLEGPDSRMLKVTHLGMMAGGTGITPMLQIMNEILKEKPSSTGLFSHLRFTLLFANKHEQDILCKEYLDSLALEFPNRFSVRYILEVPPEDSSKHYHQGFITASLIKETMPSPTEEGSMIFICGPDPMIKYFAGSKNKDKSQGPLMGVLKDCGYTEANVFKF